LIVGSNGNALGRDGVAVHRENAASQIDGRFAANIERVGRHDAEQAGAIANEGASHGQIACESVSTRRPEPAEARIKNPAAVVIGQPAPRLIANETEAPERIVVPASISKRAPAHTDAIRAPAVAESRDGVPGAVGVQISET